MAEGQVWEAVQLAGYYKLNNLIAIVDVNRLGQRGETMVGWQLAEYQKRGEAFGWRTIIIQDGHDIGEIQQTYQKIDQEKSDRPVMVIAKTIKGKGVSFLENQDGWHGKPLTKEQLQSALKALGNIDFNVRGNISQAKVNFQFSDASFQSSSSYKFLNKKNQASSFQPPASSYSTREAYGDALVELGKKDLSVVVLDAEVSNSTFAEKFKKNFPERFFEMFIAEQNMISAALGMAKLGFIPFVSSFAAFLTRSFDQLRMAQYSNPNLKIVGSHAGVSIGPDGPSQMGLEDLAMMRAIKDSTIFYPSDAVACFKLTELAAETQGLIYIRTTREKTEVIYKPDEKFEIGGFKLHQLKPQNAKVKLTDQKATVIIISAGITVYEGLKAQKQLADEGVAVDVIDLYCIKPISAKLKSVIASHSSAPTNIIVVEDHYPAGGLGEAVLSTLITNYQISKAKQIPITNNLNFYHLCVRKTPRSGTKEELLAYEEIDVDSIINLVKNIVK